MDGAVGADLCTGTALLAFGLVDVCHVVLIERNRAEPAGILAPVCQTSAAGIGHLVAAHRAFVAGNIDDLNDIRIAPVSAHCDFHTLGKNGALLIDTAPHGRNFPRHNGLRNIDCGLCQASCPCLPRHFSEHLVFQMLNLCIKFPHFLPPRPQTVPNATSERLKNN